MRWKLERSLKLMGVLLCAVRCELDEFSLIECILGRTERYLIQESCEDAFIGMKSVGYINRCAVTVETAREGLQQSGDRARVRSVVRYEGKCNF